MNTASSRCITWLAICPCLITAALMGCGSADVSRQASLEDPGTASQQQVQEKRGPISATVTISPEDPQLSDVLTVTLTVTAPEDIFVKLPDFQSAFPDLTVRDFQDPLPRISAGQKSMTQVYTLEPMMAGELVIPAFVITYRENQKPAKSTDTSTSPGELVTSELPFTVTTIVSAEDLSLDRLKPPASPIALSKPERPFPLLQWLVGTASVFVGFVVWLIWRKKKTILELQSPSEVAASELNVLIADKSARNDVSAFYVRLTAIVRRYIEAVTGIKAAEQTTEEFLQEMQERRLFSDSSKLRLQEFLEASDLIKFAGKTPDSESVEGSIRAAQQFIQLPPDDNQNLTTTSAG